MVATGTYCAFYVGSPFNPSALGAHATKDFCYYNLLKSWKGADSTFPFSDEHASNYNVRDGSDWERTLKPRLRERLRSSKKIVLFLSSVTANSQALREEIDYGINWQGLPVIVVYPDYKEKSELLSYKELKSSVRNLWDKLPKFRDSMSEVPTLHVPMKKALIRSALLNTDFNFATKTSPGVYFYT